MNETKKKALRRAAATLALLAVGFGLLVGGCELAVNGMKNKLETLSAGERWSTDGSPYAVISTSLDSSAAVSADTVEGWEYSLSDALTNASVDAGDGASSFTWCASFTASGLSPRGSKGSSSAVATVCLGNFFLFHPFDFLYGSGFLNDNSNPMGVVLDERLAWNLFGATDIVGMTLWLGEEEYTITGVVRPETEKGIYGHTYGNTPRMYLNYYGYSKYADGSFTSFEAALPNPVKDFAKGIYDGVVTVSDNTGTTLEATRRYTIKNRLENAKKLSYLWISSDTVDYPYWENEARMYDYRAATLLVLEIVAAAIALLLLVFSVSLVYASGFRIGKTVRSLVGKGAGVILSKKKTSI